MLPAFLAALVSKLRSVSCRQSAAGVAELISMSNEAFDQSIAVPSAVTALENTVGWRIVVVLKSRTWVSGASVRICLYTAASMLTGLGEMAFVQGEDVSGLFWISNST